MIAIAEPVHGYDTLRKASTEPVLVVHKPFEAEHIMALLRIRRGTSLAVCMVVGGVVGHVLFFVVCMDVGCVLGHVLFLLRRKQAARTQILNSTHILLVHVVRQRLEASYWSLRLRRSTRLLPHLVSVGCTSRQLHACEKQRGHSRYVLKTEGDSLDMPEP